MHSISAARWLGVASILAVVVSSLIILYRTPVEKGRSMSAHIGQTRQNYLLFAWGSTVSVICMALYLWLWVIPELHLPTAFDVIAALVLIGQLGTGWARFIPGPGWDTHSVFAYTTAGLMPVMISFFILADASDGTKLIAGTVTGWMIFCLGLMFLPNIKRYYLPFQVVYMAGYCVVMVLVGYLL